MHDALPTKLPYSPFALKMLLSIMLLALITPWAYADDPAPDDSAPVAWDQMTVDQKLETTRDAVLTSNEEGVVTGPKMTAVDLDTLWVCLAAFLVFFMQAGFAMVESGFTRAKNACNIIMKNLMDFAFGSILFWLVGFGLMFGASYHGLFGIDKFFYDAGDNSFDWSFLLFQTMFCATAGTIVSGAIAERTKFTSYLLYTIVITAIIYPIFGSWVWNPEGWLCQTGFHDFAGSTVVHSIGGWAALAGAMIVGPRIGKYSGKKINAIPGHNIPLAALGVFILWLGWFGFNPGSTVAVGGGSFAYIAMTTNISAACGSVSAMLIVWILFKKADISFALNGALAGLVGITAGCDCISIPMAALTGTIAGLIVVLSCIAIDRLRIDDPVGAISVHGVCGSWGTLAVGLFSMENGLITGHGFELLGIQALGIGSAFLWAFPTSLGVFMLLKKVMGLRVSKIEEEEGLDLHEHGLHAYPSAFIGLGEVPPSFVAAPKTVSANQPSLETT